MEIIFWGNRLKLENGKIYNYRKINHTSKKMDWCKVSFRVNSGYLKCDLTNNKKKKNVFFHRLIYLFYNPDFDILNPKIILDHIDRDKLNNSIDNLRIATKQENSFNTDAKGCCFDKSKNKWKCRIMVSGKVIYLGYYLTEEEAHEAYLKAKKIYHKID